MHGINPKRWFYGFRADLQSRAAFARTVLSGAAAEHWLAGELFGHLAANIGGRIAVFPEVGTRDLTFYRVQSGRCEPTPVGSIEMKLVYRTYSETKLRSYVRELLDQVAKNKKDAGRTYGYLYAVHVVANDHRPKVRATFSSFREIVRRILREECLGAGMSPARQYLETILDEEDVAIGGLTYRVGVAGQYLEAGSRA